MLFPPLWTDGVLCTVIPAEHRGLNVLQECEECEPCLTQGSASLPGMFAPVGMLLLGHEPLRRSWVPPGSRRPGAVAPWAGSPRGARCWVPWARSPACHLTVDHACGWLGSEGPWEEGCSLHPAPGQAQGRASSVRPVRGARPGGVSAFSPPGGQRHYTLILRTCRPELRC